MVDELVMNSGEKSMSSATGPAGGYVVSNGVRGGVTKAQANYTDHASNPQEQCHFCRHFIDPDGCAIVKGQISKEGWCKHFEKGAHKADEVIGSNDATKGDHSSDAMIAFMIDPHVALHLYSLGQAAGLSSADLTPINQMHLTLVYLTNDISQPGPMSDEDNMCAILDTFAHTQQVIQGSVNGLLRFVDNPDKDCIALSFDSPQLPAFRNALMETLKARGIDPVETHSFTPHITLAYVPKDFETPNIHMVPFQTSFDTLTLMWGDMPYRIPLPEPNNVPASVYAGKGKKAMPYKIVKRNDKYFVLNQSNGERRPEGGYPSRDEAINYLRALEANVSDAKNEVSSQLMGTDVTNSDVAKPDAPNNAPDNATDPRKAEVEAQKTSVDGDDDSNLILVGHRVFWKEGDGLMYGLVTEIIGEEATIQGGGGVTITKPLSLLEPTEADDEDAPEIKSGADDGDKTEDIPANADMQNPQASTMSAKKSVEATLELPADDVEVIDEDDEYFDVNNPTGVKSEPVTEVQPEVAATKAEDGAGDSMHYAFPDEKKLPMPDAYHVVLAAAALGPKPPHGHHAQIPSDKLGEVKGKIRARARELSLGKEDMAKVNAYLSGHMPGDLSEKDSERWANVYHETYGETQDEIKAALAAQGAINRHAMIGTKSVNGLPTKVEGWMMLFTNPEELDLQGTYFDSMTRTLMDYYPNAPLWMEHGKDPDYGADPIGKRTLAKIYPRGIWGEHDLHTNHPLYRRTAANAAKGLYAYSSDSLPHYAQVGYDPQNGRLGEWPLAGCSLTMHPAEPGLGPVKAMKSLEEALKSVALEREASGTQTGAVKPMKDEVPMDEDTEDVGGTQSVDETTTAVKEAPEAEEDEKEKAAKAESETENEEEDAAKAESETEPDADDATKDGLTQVDSANDDFDADDEPHTTLHALAKMYGCEAEPESVRKAMDTHIDRIKAEGPHPELLKALGLSDDAKADDVTSHLNNLYSAAMSSEKDDVPSSTMAQPDGYNYNVLHRHLSSGGAKSVGPFMTGTIAEKGVNFQSGVTKAPLVGVYADLLRIRRMEPPKYVIGGQKAMSSASGPNGGYILHQEIAPNVLDPLRAKVVCYQLGAEHIDMQGTNVLTVPVMNSAPEAYWVGENQAVQDSQPGYRTVTLYPHGVSSLVKVPFNVEANMTPQAETQLRNQMAKSIGLKIDKAAMLGTGGALTAGGGMEIIGILNTPNSQTYDLGGNGRVPQFTDIGQAFGLLDDQNVPYDDASRRGIALHSQISRAFTLATDTLGNPLLRPAWRAAAEREIMAMPYAISNQIPTNVVEGTSTNSSYIFGGDWQYMYIGLSDQVEVRLDQTFAGNLQAGLLIYVYADVKIVYPQAFFTMKGVLPISISGVSTGTVSGN